MGDWNRKLTEEEKRKWDDVMLGTLTVGMLAILFVAAAGSAIDSKHQREQEQQQQQDEHSISIDIEEDTTQAPDTLSVKPSQFKAK